MVHQSYYDSKMGRIRDLSCGDVRVYLEVAVRRVSGRRCGKVKRERLDWLAASLLYRKRFVWFVGRRCRGMSIRDVAMEVHLDCLMVKGLERQDMAEQLKKGHTYRIVVSDLERNQVRRSYCQM